MGASEPLATRSDARKLERIELCRCGERKNRRAGVRGPDSDSLRAAGKSKLMTHDSEYFRRQAAEARAAASAKGRGEEAEVAGELALAYAALARRRAEADGEAPNPAAAAAELA